MLLVSLCLINTRLVTSLPSFVCFCVSEAWANAWTTEKCKQQFTPPEFFQYSFHSETNTIKAKHVFTSVMFENVYVSFVLRFKEANYTFTETGVTHVMTCFLFDHVKNCSELMLVEIRSLRVFLLYLMSPEVFVSSELFLPLGSVWFCLCCPLPWQD